MKADPTDPASGGGATTAVLATDRSPVGAATVPEPAAAPAESASRRRPALAGAPRVAVAMAGTLALFGVLMLLKGVNPVVAYRDMLTGTLSSPTSLGGIVVRATPLVLAALAVAVPARAGLINVGGEGQLVMGGVAAMGVSMGLDGALPGPLTLVLMAVAAMVAGASWSGVAAVLRLKVGISESVTTLLLNYIALDVMYFLIYERWKDRQGSGQPATRAVTAGERLPLLGDTRVHLGILLAVVATVVVFLVFRTTSWGFRLRVVGGNPEAARRAGLKVGALLLGAMVVGGALAGLGGFTQLAGAEFKLRSGFLVGYGYVGFLASWLAGHKPVGVLLSCVLLSTIVIGGDSLQLDAGLPAASVNVLLALLLLGVFGFARTKEAPR